MSTASGRIVLDEGRYRAKRAAQVTADDSRAMTIADAMIEVYTGAQDTRCVKGVATIENLLLTNLLEESDEIDLILDLTGGYKYRLFGPQIRSGKIFPPDVHSTVQFIPTSPWQQIPEKEFDDYYSGLRFIKQPG
ncbi:MAG: hypothetical protein DSY90_00180 [Deltaproteobacteria bacterium]|nr:MAG: hypothetical protein DSY90_00180 [Deltaproteobacteria bacterium]